MLSLERRMVKSKNGNVKFHAVTNEKFVKSSVNEEMRTKTQSKHEDNVLPRLNFGSAVVSSTVEPF